MESEVKSIKSLDEAFVITKALIDTTLIEKEVKVVMDFPIAGVRFLDFTCIMKNPLLMDEMEKFFLKYAVDFDVVIAPEARGFIFATMIARTFRKPFVPIRKAGKLPRATATTEGSKEYGGSILQCHTNDIKAGDRVLIVDDVLATGGTIEACANLMRSLGAIPVQFMCAFDLTYLNGREKTNLPIVSAVEVDIR